MTSYILLVPIQIFENLQTSPCRCEFKTDKASGDLQKLSPGISTVCPLNNSRKTKLGRRQAKPIIHLLLPSEQAEFRHGKPTVYQFVLLFSTGDIEVSFKAKRKDCILILALISSCDCVALWLCLQDAHIFQISTCLEYYDN